MMRARLPPPRPPLPVRAPTGAPQEQEGEQPHHRQFSGGVFRPCRIRENAAVAALSIERARGGFGFDGGRTRFFLLRQMSCTALEARAPRQGARRGRCHTARSRLPPRRPACAEWRSRSAGRGDPRATTRQSPPARPTCPPPPAGRAGSRLQPRADFLSPAAPPRAPRLRRPCALPLPAGAARVVGAAAWGL